MLQFGLLERLLQAQRPCPLSSTCGTAAVSPSRIRRGQRIALRAPAGTSEKSRCAHCPPAAADDPPCAPPPFTSSPPASGAPLTASRTLACRPAPPSPPPGRRRAPTTETSNVVTRRTRTTSSSTFSPDIHWQLSLISAGISFRLDGKAPPSADGTAAPAQKAFSLELCATNAVTANRSLCRAATSSACVPMEP